MEINFYEDRGLILWMALGLILSVLFLFVIYRFIGAFVTALFVYYGSRPIYKQLDNRTTLKRPSVLSALSLLLLFFPVLLLIGYTILIGTQEVSAFLNSVESEQLTNLINIYFPEYNSLSSLTSSIQNPSSLFSEAGIQSFMSVLDYAFNYFGTISSIILNIFITLVLSYYFLKEDKKIVEMFSSKFNFSKTTKQYVKKVDKDFNKVFFGNILNAIVTAFIGILIYTVLEISIASQVGISMKYPVLIGLLCGIGSLIPIVGMKLVYLPVFGYLTLSSFQSGASSLAIWYPIVFFIVSMVVVDGIPDIIIRPYVSSGDIHLGSLLIAYIIGPLLFGWYGLFLGPMLLVLGLRFYTEALPRIISGRNIENHTLFEWNN